MNYLRAIPYKLKGRLSICVIGNALTLAVGLACGTAGATTIGYWRFEEGTPPNPATAPGSVLDSSGHGLNATPSGGPLYSSVLPPWAGGVGSTRSMQFDGSSQRLYVP